MTLQRLGIFDSVPLLGVVLYGPVMKSIIALDEIVVVTQTAVELIIEREARTLATDPDSGNRRLRPSRGRFSFRFKIEANVFTLRYIPLSNSY